MYIRGEERRRVGGMGKERQINREGNINRLIETLVNRDRQANKGRQIERYLAR